MTEVPSPDDRAGPAPGGMASPGGARPSARTPHPRLDIPERWLIVGMFVVAALAFLVVVVMLGVASD